MGGEADIHWRSKYPLEREISPWREIVTHSPWRGTSLVAESPGSHPYTHPPVTQPVPYVLQTDTHTYTHTHAHTHKFKYTHIMPCGGRCMVCTHKQPLEHFKITCMIQYLIFYFTSKKSLKISWKKKRNLRFELSTHVSEKQIQLWIFLPLICSQKLPKDWLLWLLWLSGKKSKSRNSHHEILDEVLRRIVGYRRLQAVNPSLSQAKQVYIKKTHSGVLSLAFLLWAWTHQWWRAGQILIIDLCTVLSINWCMNHEWRKYNTEINNIINK